MRFPQPPPPPSPKNPKKIEWQDILIISMAKKIYPKGACLMRVRMIFRTPTILRVNHGLNIDRFYVLCDDVGD